MGIGVDFLFSGSLAKLSHAGVYYPKPYKHSSPQYRSFNRVYHNQTYRPHFNIQRGQGLFNSTQSTSVHGVSMKHAARYSHESNVRSFGRDGERLNEDLHTISGKVSSRHRRQDIQQTNEKETMRLLNDRLASYMTEVDSLKEHNLQLEKNIQEVDERNQAYNPTDYSEFYKVISNIQSQISSVHVNNATLFKQIHDASLAADDFRNMYEDESWMKGSAEQNITGMQKVLEGIQMQNHDLNTEIQSLMEELEQLNSNREEEVQRLKDQLGIRVNVAVDAPLTTDLNQALSAIREEYERLLQQNLKESEEASIYLNLEIENMLSSGGEHLQEFHTEVISLRHTVHTLEIEMQAQLQLKSILESSLEEMCENNAMELTQFQNAIDKVEHHLGEILLYTKDLNHEYNILIDQKTYIEKEIAAYRHLIEGYSISASTHTLHSPIGNNGSDRDLCL
uniref:IF rod domain-containing protein n=1 Tax=Leptobrachium leishanense TaxID=445787 RepID=A0A8C5QJ33_9ANUR